MKVLFFSTTRASYVSGAAPIYIHATIEGERFQKAIQPEADPETWDGRLVKSKEESTSELNYYYYYYYIKRNGRAPFLLYNLEYRP
jgi:hypothetical protein